MFPGAAPEQSYSSGYSHESNNYLTNMLNPQELEQVEVIFKPNYIMKILFICLIFSSF